MLEMCGFDMIKRFNRKTFHRFVTATGLCSSRDVTTFTVK